MNSIKLALIATAVGGALSLAAVPASAVTVPGKSAVATEQATTQVRYGHRHHGGHWRGPRYGFSIGVPLYAGSYYAGCSWLHRRAVETGSRYWWRRYRECRGW